MQSRQIVQRISFLYQSKKIQINKLAVSSVYQSGVTLIELIMSMVIISIALTGVFTVMNLTVSHSADPLINHQAIAIAESYMDEVLLQDYVVGSGSARNEFDDVDDYDGLDESVTDNQGDLVAILSNYNVKILVKPLVPPIDSVDQKEITVTVTGIGTTVRLVGYRANY